jgi:TonB family protein
VKSVSLIGIALIGLFPSIAAACSISPPKTEDLLRSVAEKGVVISGTVVQVLDAGKRTSQIIRADKIFIGDKRIRDFEIAPSLKDWLEIIARPIPAPCTFDPVLKQGQHYERLVLMPVYDAKNLWRFETFSFTATSDRNLPLLMTEARRTGRFRAVPDPLLPPPPTPLKPRPKLSALAIPVSKPSDWIKRRDYPPAQRAARNEGVGTYYLAIGKDGSTIGCVITKSSGFRDLDLHTCALLKQRAKFTPAKDAKGVPTWGSYADNFEWKLR